MDSEMPDTVTTAPELTDDWYIIEMLGHRRVVGRCREVEIAGAKMIRIDVPCDPPATQYVTAASLYAITPTTEEVARKLAERIGNPSPVSRYELLPPRKAEPEDHDPDFDEIDDGSARF